MKVKLRATGTSAKPERMRLLRERRISGAVSMRWTISWSVPWVAMVTKTAAKKAVKIVYSVSRMRLRLPKKPRAARFSGWGSMPESQKESAERAVDWERDSTARVACFWASSGEVEGEDLRIERDLALTTSASTWGVETSRLMTSQPPTAFQRANMA